jgi:hypothetical protein
MGYRFQSKRRGDFEIEGVSETLIRKFSKRHTETTKRPGSSWTGTRPRSVETSMRYEIISPTGNGEGTFATSICRVWRNSGTYNSRGRSRSPCRIWPPEVRHRSNSGKSLRDYGRGGV